MKIMAKFGLLVGCLISLGATCAVASLTVQTASTYLRSLNCTPEISETAPRAHICRLEQQADSHR